MCRYRERLGISDLDLSAFFAGLSLREDGSNHVLTTLTISRSLLVVGRA